MYDSITINMRGLVPLIVHNGQLADPMNPIVKEMKTYTAKKKKTEEDLAAHARLEFLGGLYVNDSGVPVIPGECLESMIVEAAKKNRLGKPTKAAILIENDYPIIYDGPKDPEKMWEDGRFRDTRRARVTASAVMRTRPKFNNWELRNVVINFLPDQINREDLIRYLQVAGRIIGLCDFRPKFGRFDFEVVK